MQMAVRWVHVFESPTNGGRGQDIHHPVEGNPVRVAQVFNDFVQADRLGDCRGRGRRGPWCSRYFSSRQASSGPRNTGNHVQAQEDASEVPGRTIFLVTATCSRDDGDSLDSCQVGGRDYRPVVRAGLADRLQFSALLWPSCAKSGILLVHGGQHEPGIPEPHEPGHIRERLKEVRATHARAKKSGPLPPTVPEPPPLTVWRSTQTGGARKPLPAPVSRPGAWLRSNGADPKTKPVKSPVAGGPRQDTVPFLSCLEEQKLRFQGQEHSAALRVPVRLGGKS